MRWTDRITRAILSDMGFRDVEIRRVEVCGEKLCIIQELFKKEKRRVKT